MSPEFFKMLYNNIPFFVIIISERRNIMTKIKEIERNIEEHRELIYQLINEKEVLTDTKLVVLSQKLDGLLNEYDDLLD